MQIKELVIGCDNAAVEFMAEVKKFLDQKGISYTFVGVGSKEDDTYYPVIAKEVAKRIIESGYTKDGILVCGTGIGMSITANKYPGIYAALVSDIYSAERARLSNNANVICMGARVIAPELAIKLLSEWLGLEYKVGNSQPKLDTIKKIEQENFYGLEK
jgi:ribose 5-phosphate isomerase B